MGFVVKKIDRLILEQICNDANISKAKLAKKIGVNTATVAKRINTMLDEKMISIQAVPDFVKMGHKILACIALNVELKHMDDIQASLSEPYNIHLVAATFGRFDLVLMGSFRNWERVDDFLNRHVARLKGVKQINIFMVSEIKTIFRDLFPNSTFDEPPVDLDDVDFHLIQELVKNGQTSYTDIANDLGLNPGTVSRRAGTLLKKEIIKIIAVPDPIKFGYQASAFIMLGTDHLKAEQICRKIGQFREIQVVMTLAVGYDILIGTQFRNPNLLYQFIKQSLSGIDGIRAFETLIVAKYFKGNFTWLDVSDLPLPS